MTHSPIGPVVERALAAGDPDELVALLTGQVRIATLERFHAVMEARARAAVAGETTTLQADAAARHLTAWARTLAELAAGEPEVP